ncbi:hypothetical protein [Nocardia sp. NPDC050435]|uniref:hypothetical protein n=1 Tax=Nocardia sp. NPDC050435 TaxID=3155040 RepID=UPI0034028349
MLDQLTREITTGGDGNPPAPKTNIAAAVAWGLGLLGAFFLAVPLALFALTRIPATDRNSRDLAYGALISGLGIPLAAILFLVLG